MSESELRGLLTAAQQERDRAEHRADAWQIAHDNARDRREAAEARVVTLTDHVGYLARLVHAQHHIMPDFDSCRHCDCIAARAALVPVPSPTCMACGAVMESDPCVKCGWRRVAPQEGTPGITKVETPGANFYVERREGTDPPEPQEAVENPQEAT